MERQVCIKKLKKFRQHRRPGAEQRRPGRSYWPEPEFIRRITGMRNPKHAELPNPVNKFPRAQFGLPIIFKFKDDRTGDPQQTELKGNKYDRLTSPLILRPITCKDGTAIGLAMILETPRIPPKGLTLKGVHTRLPIENKLDNPEANSIPMLNGEKDVLKAFLKKLGAK